MTIQQYYDAKSLHDSMVDYAVQYDIEDVKVLQAMEVLYKNLNNVQDKYERDLRKLI